ncbi:MAG TPA: ComEC/Rec2 family competence protein, partial [Marinilabiliaceae bacterium]|nr:ComEC/Rec2 family competence protein [Marinilabiliaceae bacterium]
MTKIHQYPFLRLLIPLAIGILFGDFMKSSIVAETVLLFLSLLFVIYLIHHRFLYKRYSLRWLSGIFTFTFLFSTGYFLILISAPIPLHEKQNISALGEISNIEERPSGWDQLTFKPLYSNDSINLEVNGNWLLLVKHEVSNNFKMYDQVVIKGSLQPLKSSTNPHSFDYGRYLVRNGFSTQMFISDTASIKLIKRKKTIRFSQIPQKVRAKCENVFVSSGVDSTSMSVVKAILLGDRSDIDKEVNQQFVKSGVIHILAVSGLHVGIIYLIINQLLSLFLKPHSHAKWIISVTLLLGYAFITGFSPSVSRAVLMFSIIQIGRSSNRDIDMYQL